MTSATSCEEVLDLIQSSRRALVISHVNPDADAYGSSCGIARVLENLGLQVQVYNESGFVPRYSVIPGTSAVQKDLPATIADDELVVVCDCGALERVGDRFRPVLAACKKVINIDHHKANPLFGVGNYVIEGASSTSELVFDIAIALEKRLSRNNLIDTNAAKCLLAGIIGDTGSFRYSSTTSKTFLVAHDLVERGAHPDVLTQELFATHSLAAIKLQAAAMLGLELHFGGAFAEVVVTQEMVKQSGAVLLDADSLAERGRDVEGVTVSALYKEDVDMWRVSLRSRQGAVDVSLIAQSFGGGGHKAAAAFRWRKDFEALQRELRAKIQQALESLHG